MNPVKPHLIRTSAISNGDQWFYTYVLACGKTDTFYTGATDDLQKD